MTETTPDTPPRTRVEETLHAIRRDIVSGALEPGAKLAVEPLRERYGVGSSTIREALSLLIPDGLVTARGQRGFAVSPISIDDLRDLGRTRILLETHALRESIAEGDDDWEAGIVAAFHRLGKAQEALDQGVPGSAGDWEVRNHQFHAALTAACRSRWVRHMLDILHHHSERYRRFALTDRTVPRDVHAEHVALMEATLARDVDTACEVAAMHIQRTTDVLAQVEGTFEAAASTNGDGGSRRMAPADTPRDAT